MLVEPYDSGDHGSGSGTFNIPSSSSSSNKLLSLEQGQWTQFRKRRVGGLNKAAYLSGKMNLQPGEVDVFIDLQSTTIDAAGASNLRANIDADLEKDHYKCRNLTVYVLQSMSKTMEDCFYSEGNGEITVKRFYTRKAICRECQPLQG